MGPSSETLNNGRRKARSSALDQIADIGVSSIRSPAEPFLDTTSDFAEIIFAILGVAAKLERRRILERTARGRADAKANGVKYGREPILTPHQQKDLDQLHRGHRQADHDLLRQRR